MQFLRREKIVNFWEKITKDINHPTPFRHVWNYAAAGEKHEKTPNKYHAKSAKKRRRKGRPASSRCVGTDTPWQAEINNNNTKYIIPGEE